MQAETVVSLPCRVRKIICPLLAKELFKELVDIFAIDVGIVREIFSRHLPTLYFFPQLHILRVSRSYGNPPPFLTEVKSSGLSSQRQLLFRRFTVKCHIRALIVVSTTKRWRGKQIPVIKISAPGIFTAIFE